MDALLRCPVIEIANCRGGRYVVYIYISPMIGFRYIYTSIFAYIYIYVRVCVCMYASVKVIIYVYVFINAFLSENT